MYTGKIKFSLNVAQFTLSGELVKSGLQFLSSVLFSCPGGTGNANGEDSPRLRTAIRADQHASELIISSYIFWMIRQELLEVCFSGRKIAFVHAFHS